MPLWRAWLPYVLIAVLLVISRLPGLGMGALLRRVSWSSESLFGTSVGVRIEPLYLPGTFFLLVCLLTVGLHRMTREAVVAAVTRSIRTTAAASVAFLFTVPMVQVFIHSDGGGAELASMPAELAKGVASLSGSAWPLWAPLVGGLGAFVAGSNTISNMMFSLFQWETAVAVGADPQWVVALQAVGGAAGNVICVHNVVAACAVAGLIGREGDVIRHTVIIFAYYVVLVGTVGWCVAY